MYSKNLIVFIINIIFSLSLFAQKPQICRIQGGHIKTIWGINFTKDETEVYSCNLEYTENQAIKILENFSDSLQNRLPLSPPSIAKKLNILMVDSTGVCMGVEFSNAYNANGFKGELIGDDVIWVKNKFGFSKPIFVHSPQLYFTYPNVVHAGEIVRVLGKKIDAKIVVIRKKEDRDLIVLKSRNTSNRSDLAVQNTLYETQVRIPSSVKPGDYQLFVHNGTGGNWGWSNPISFTVKPKEAQTKLIFAKKFGVKANGISDDTEALKKALRYACRTGGTVVLEPGNHVIHETIELPIGVSIKGSSCGATIFNVNPNIQLKGGLPKEAVFEKYANDWQESLQTYTPMFWLRSKSGLSDLSINYGEGTGMGILIAKCNGIADDVFVKRVNILANERADGWYSSYSIVLAGASSGLQISDCDMRGWGGISIISNNHWHSYIGRNKIVVFPTGKVNALFTMGLNESIVECNEVYYGLRNYASHNGLSYGKNNNPIPSFDTEESTTHLAMIGNVYINSLARRHNDGELMIEAGVSQFCGKVISASDTSVSFQGNPFPGKLKNSYVVILDGKGVGQYKKVSENSLNTLFFKDIWSIVPDTTTKIVFGGSNVENLWIDNTITNNASWVGFWGNCIGNVIDGQIMRDGGPLYLWAWSKKDKPGVVAFNEIIGTRTIGGGGISLLGKPVFGNTIRFCEVIDFSYYPTFHINPTWLQADNYQVGIDKTFGIGFKSNEFKYNFINEFSGITNSKNLNRWNVFDGNNIYRGPNGIYLSPASEYSILSKNAISVEKQKIVNNSKSSIIIQ